MVRAAAPAGWTAWTINQHRTGSHPPPHRGECAPADQYGIRECVPCYAAGASPRPTGWNVSARRKWNVPASGGTHRSRPTVHIGSPSMFVGRGIPDAPPPHPIRGRQGCRPLRFGCSVVHPGGGEQVPPYGVESIGPSGTFWRTPTDRTGIGLGQNLLRKTVCGPFTFVQFVKISFDFFVPH